MLQLTSYERMRRYISNSDGTPVTASIGLQRELTNWILSVSKQIETYLGRYLELSSYTEYFDIGYSMVEFFPKGNPITSITSVSEDSSGLWDGSESTVDGCFVGSNRDSVNLPLNLEYVAKNALKIIYAGGLSPSGVLTVLSVLSVTGFVVGKFTSSTSGACGIVKIVGTLSITVEVLFGMHAAGDTLTQYDDELVTPTNPAVSTTVSAITSAALCETYPDLARACEIQIRQTWKHKSDFELSGTNKDGTSLRRQDTVVSIPFIQESINLLLPYRRMVL